MWFGPSGGAGVGGCGTTDEVKEREGGRTGGVGVGVGVVDLQIAAISVQHSFT